MEKFVKKWMEHKKKTDRIWKISYEGGGSPDPQKKLTEKGWLFMVYGAGVGGGGSPKP